MPVDTDEWRERIDTDVRGLSERMAGVESGLKSLGLSFDKWTRSFETFAQTEREASRTLVVEESIDTLFITEEERKAKEDMFKSTT